MPKPHPPELRERVANAWLYNEGSFIEIAERFNVGSATVNRWLGRLRRTGSLTPDPMGGARRPRMVTNEGKTVIRDVLDSIPDATLPEVCAALEEATKTKVSPQTMSKVVRRLGYSKKKARSARSLPSGPALWEKEHAS